MVSTTTDQFLPIKDVGSIVVGHEVVVLRSRWLDVKVQLEMSEVSREKTIHFGLRVVAVCEVYIYIQWVGVMMIIYRYIFFCTCRYMNLCVYIYIHACDVQHDTILCLDVLLVFSYILVLHLCIRILYGAPARKGSIRTGFDNPKMCVFLCIESSNLGSTKKWWWNKRISHVLHIVRSCFFHCSCRRNITQRHELLQIANKVATVESFLCHVRFGVRDSWDYFFGKLQSPQRWVPCLFCEMLRRWLESWREALTIL